MDDVFFSENSHQEETIDIKQYLYLFWQWAWLIILVAVLAGGGAYAYSQRMTPIFQASATALVDVPSINTSEYSAVITSEMLSRTYSQIMTNTGVMQETINRLGLQMAPQQLAGMISAQGLADTQLIRVSVQSTDPTAAAAIANTVIEVFSADVKETQSSRYSLSKSSLELQMADIESKISTLNTQLQSATRETEIDNLETKIAQYQGIYSSLLNSYEQIRLSEAQTLTSLTLIEPATVPAGPIQPRVLMNTAIGGLTGLLLTAGGIFAIEALDDKIKSPADVKEKLGLPVLGIIDTFSQKNGDSLIAARQPRSWITEAFRTLRTNVMFASVDNELKSILVTSAEPGEGKTVVSANLAVVFAQSGRKTVAMDADLRHPQLHKRFDISNNRGITSLFYDRRDLEIDQFWRTTGSNENLKVLTSGKLPPNPAELLASERMKKLLADVKNRSDMLVIDSPPVLAVTDAVILASLVDGVLIVIQPGKTKFGTARHTIEELNRANANILGVVIKFMGGRGSKYAKRYGYYTASDYNYHLAKE